MSSGPDLFVICKNCGSEVSPYITECPYCGNRLRKRAPKLERGGRPAAEPKRRTASLPRLRRGEIPGIRPEARPYAMLGLLVLGLLGCLLWRTALVDQTQLVVFASDWHRHIWRLLTAAFTFENTGYAFVTLGGLALFGWLIESRHGPLAVVALYLIGAVGGIALTAALSEQSFVFGGGGGAIALLVAWALPDVMAVRQGEDIDGDLIGVAVIAAVLGLMPLAAPEASWLDDAAGLIVGLVIGLPLARAARR